MSLGQIVITSCEFRCFFCETHRFRRWEPNPLCRSLVPGALGHPSCPVVANETIEAGSAFQLGSFIFVFTYCLMYSCCFPVFHEFHVTKSKHRGSQCFMMPLNFLARLVLLNSLRRVSISIIPTCFTGSK